MNLLPRHLMLMSLFFSTIANVPADFQTVLTQVLDGIKERQTPILAAATCSTTAAYIGYAIYLDTVINNKDCLWHWTLHHLKDGIIDHETIMGYIEDRYPDFNTLHPLTAIFAASHEAQKEIDICLSLRGALKNLKYVGLEWVMSETITRLDKKLECLYTLKIMLTNCAAQTRSRCKKRAQL